MVFSEDGTTTAVNYPPSVIIKAAGLACNGVCATTAHTPAATAAGIGAILGTAGGGSKTLTAAQATGFVLTGFICGSWTAAQTLRLVKAYDAAAASSTNTWGTAANLAAGGDAWCSMWNDDTDIATCSTSKDGSGMGPATLATGNGAIQGTQDCCLLTFTGSFGAAATDRDNMVGTGDTKLCYGRGHLVKPGATGAELFYGDSLCLRAEQGTLVKVTQYAATIATQSLFSGVGTTVSVSACSCMHHDAATTTTTTTSTIFTIALSFLAILAHLWK